MKRTFQAGWTYILAAALAWGALLTTLPQVFGQDAPIEIIGDVSKIKVVKVIEIQEDRTLVKKPPFELRAPEGGLLYRWRWPAGSEVLELGRILKVTSTPKGDVTFTVQYAVFKIDFDKKTQDIVEKAGVTTFIVGEAPAPVVVPPPPPIIDPKIPLPPPLTPSPISAPGFRVFIVYDSEKPSAALNTIISGPEFRAFVDAKCVKDDTTPARRFYDDTDTDLANDYPWVREAMKRPRASLPWIVIGNFPHGGYEGALPLTNAPHDAISLLKKFAP